VTGYPAGQIRGCDQDAIAELFSIFTCPRIVAKGSRLETFFPLDAEKYEPEHAEDQHGEAGRNRQKREHRRTGFGLPRFGRSFDDPMLLLRSLSRCHGGLDFLGCRVTRRST